MIYTLTKYLTADYLRENDFIRAYLDLVDEIIFCCNMEALDILSNMSFEDMDDNYFIEYINFFLNGLSTYNIEELDRKVLSEWFSLLHVRGELSDIDKLFRFGGSLKNREKNVFGLYNNADVPNQTINETKDGVIYLITDNNMELDDDFLINQQIPAGYRIGLIRNPDPFLVNGGDKINLEKDLESYIHINSGDSVDLLKELEGTITFYRRRQFDQYYSFSELYRSQYTINQLSKFHERGYYFFGFEVEEHVPFPSEYNEEQNIYNAVNNYSGVYYIGDAEIIEPEIQQDFDLIFVDSGGNIVSGFNFEPLVFSPVSFFTIDNGEEIIFVEESPFPVVCSFSASTTPQSVAPDSAFDTGLIMYGSKLYACATDDGQGSITRYGWECGEMPAIPLPTVTISSKWLVLGANAGDASGGNVTIQANATRAGCWWDDGSSSFIASVYDSSVVYAVVRAAKTPWEVVARIGLPVENVGGAIGVRNLTGASILVYQAQYAYCDDLSATVVTVYDANDDAYNAFKFTMNGTDYYYVLDGTQTDWTDDLSSIGYHLPVDVLFYFSSSHSQINFDYPSNVNYWYAIPVNASDKTKLENMGLSFQSDYLMYNTGFNFEILAVYSDVGETAAQFDLSYLRVGYGKSSLDADYYRACIWSSYQDSTSLQTWKCRITKL